jgi:hypothetical protein
LTADPGTRCCFSDTTFDLQSKEFTLENKLTFEGWLGLGYTQERYWIDLKGKLIKLTSQNRFDI